MSKVSFTHILRLKKGCSKWMKENGKVSHTEVIQIMHKQISRSKIGFVFVAWIQKDFKNLFKCEIGAITQLITEQVGRHCCSNYLCPRCSAQGWRAPTASCLLPSDHPRECGCKIVRDTFPQLINCPVANQDHALRLATPKVVG